MAERPRIAPGVELLGEYQDSGLREPTYLARLPDGRVAQLSELLQLVLQQADGRHDPQRIAEYMSGKLGRQVSADNVRFLVAEKLRPAGLVAAADGSSLQPPSAPTVFGLRLRVAIIPAAAVHRLARAFSPLFQLPAVLAVLVGVGAFDGWLFFVHGPAQGVRTMLYQPAYVPLVYLLMVASAAFHELGHASACSYGGGRPGRIGAGLYLVWPAFFTNVTDAYRLSRTGRIRTDLGGVYFNAIFALGAGGAYLVTRSEPLLVLVVLQHVFIVQQLLPLMRLDGYYLLSDLTGVPDILSRLKPVLLSWLPGRSADPHVDQLQPWVRTVISIWLVITLAAALAVYALIALAAPRVLSTGADAFRLRVSDVAASLAGGRLDSALVASLQALILMLPSAAILILASSLAKRLVVNVWNLGTGRPVARAAMVLGAAAAAGGLVMAWAQPHSNRPIQPSERGTAPLPAIPAAPLADNARCCDTNPQAGASSPTGSPSAQMAHPNVNARIQPVTAPPPTAGTSAGRPSSAATPDHAGAKEPSPTPAQPSPSPTAATASPTPAGPAMPPTPSGSANAPGNAPASPPASPAS